MTRARRYAKPIALFGAETAALATLHRLGDLDWLRVPWGDLPAWLSTNSPAETIAALARWGAFLAVGWLVLVTALYAVAQATKQTSRTIGRFTPGLVRRAIDGAVIASIPVLVGAAPPPAMASEPPIPHPVAEAARPATTEVVIPAGPARVGWPVNAPEAPVPSVTTGAAEPTHTHLVRRDDTLWSIAADHLEAARPAVPAVTVRRYWLDVIEANAESLRSGDPDLIYPGEIIILPEPGTTGP